jgi:hypothetical protein
MISFYVRNLLFAAAGLFISFVAFWWSLFGEAGLIRNYVLVDPGSDLKFEDWLQAFVQAGTLSLVICAAFVVVWVVFAGIDSGTQRNWVVYWWLIWVLCAAVSLAVTYLQIPMPRVGLGWSWGFPLLNNIVFFWLATVATTPATHRYDPLGSLKIRRALPF